MAIFCDHGINSAKLVLLTLQQPRSTSWAAGWLELNILICIYTTVPFKESLAMCSPGWLFLYGLGAQLKTTLTLFGQLQRGSSNQP